MSCQHASCFATDDDDDDEDDDEGGAVVVEGMGGRDVGRCDELASLRSAAPAAVDVVGRGVDPNPCRNTPVSKAYRSAGDQCGSPPAPIPVATPLPPVLKLTKSSMNRRRHSTPVFPGTDRLTTSH